MRSIRAASSTSSRPHSRLASLATMSRLRPTPAACYIHPKATHLVDREGDHDPTSMSLARACPTISPGLPSSAVSTSATASSRWEPGSGGITARYEQGREVVATDVSAPCVRALRERFVDHRNVEAEDRDLRVWSWARASTRCSWSTCSSTLPTTRVHFGGSAGCRSPQECRAIRARPQALYGRTGREDRSLSPLLGLALARGFRAPGLEPVELRWVNFLAIPAWATFGRRDVDDPQRSGRLLSLWDRTAVPAARFLEGHVRTPIGLNVLGVGRRPAEPPRSAVAARPADRFQRALQRDRRGVDAAANLARRWAWRSSGARA